MYVYIDLWRVGRDKILWGAVRYFCYHIMYYTTWHGDMESPLSGEEGGSRWKVGRRFREYDRNSLPVTGISFFVLYFVLVTGISWKNIQNSMVSFQQFPLFISLFNLYIILFLFFIRISSVIFLFNDILKILTLVQKICISSFLQC